jgi:hypothetical protein
MKTAICTISSNSHLFKAESLFASLQRKTHASFCCLVTDAETADIKADSIYFYDLNSFQTEDALAMKAKYKGNRLRWGFKPLFISKLLQEGYDSVIYVDNDIFFYASPDFLFEELEKSTVLLTPHFYPADPLKDQNWMEANFRVGLYNGGFLGANQQAIPVLDWWTKSCLYNIKKSYRRGLFDDQKYLDLFPILFEDVQVLKHKGCNVAGWNMETSPRSLNEKNEIMLDARWPLIFIHFNYYTIQTIIRHKDPLLQSCWNEYLEMLLSKNPRYNYQKEIKSIRRDLLLYFDYIRYRTARLGE